MSTKKTTDTTQSTQFAPAGMAAYQSMTPQMQQVMSMYMQNPLTASYFQNQLGMANKQVGQQGQSNIFTMLNNARQFGSQGNNAFMQSQLNQQSRAQSGNQSNAFTNLLLGAEGNRRWAAGGAAGYSPLATGSKGNQTETTSGLGTWLPQLLGGALGAATGGMFGGMSGGSGGSTFLGGASGSAGGPLNIPQTMPSLNMPQTSLTNPFMR